MDLGLKGKTALVTGASIGIGRGIALALAREGARIAAIGRTEAKLHDTCHQIEDFGGEAIPVVADVNHTNDIQRTIAATIKAFGRLDILVNNAFGIAIGPLLTLTDEDFDRSMNGSALSTFGSSGLLVSIATGGGLGGSSFGDSGSGLAVGGGGATAAISADVGG